MFSYYDLTVTDCHTPIISDKYKLAEIEEDRDGYLNEEETKRIIL